MLNELGGTDENAVLAPASARPIDLRARLRAAVEEVFFVESENDDLPEPVTASYTGQLILESAAAYDKLDALFTPMNHVPVFLIENQRQVVRAVRGRIQPKPRPWWPNAVLLVMTILSLLFVGATMELSEIKRVTDILRGWPYALGVMLILGTHELGHYFAARYHK